MSNFFLIKNLVGANSRFVRTNSINCYLKVTFVVAMFFGTTAANSEPASETNDIVPVIEIRDVPMSAVIDNLARQAGINYIFDTRLIKWWLMPDSDGRITHEPILNFRWENLSAKQALLQLLKEHNLVLAEDPVTSIARVTYTNQIVNPIDASLLGSDTNMIPGVIRYQDIPITDGLENLVRQSGSNYALVPIIGYGLPDKNGQIKVEPSLTFRWENVTAKQGFIAICENYDLVIAKVPATSILLLTSKDHPIKNFVDASLLGSDTNGFIPFQIIGDLIFQGQACSDTNAIVIDSVPLDVALTQLAKTAQIKIILDPRLSGKNNPSGEKSFSEPIISVHWFNFTARQAIVALCENYDLIITKDAETGDIRIKPKD